MSEPDRVHRPHLMVLRDTPRGGIELYAPGFRYEPTPREAAAWIEQLSQYVRRRLPEEPTPAVRRAVGFSG